MSGYCPGCGRTDMAGITHVCPPPAALAAAPDARLAEALDEVLAILDEGECIYPGRFGHAKIREARALAAAREETT